MILFSLKHLSFFCKFETCETQNKCGIVDQNYSDGLAHWSQELAPSPLAFCYSSGLVHCWMHTFVAHHLWSRQVSSLLKQLRFHCFGNSDCWKDTSVAPLWWTDQISWPLKQMGNNWFWLPGFWLSAAQKWPDVSSLEGGN